MAKYKYLSHKHFSIPNYIVIYFKNKEVLYRLVDFGRIMTYQEGKQIPTNRYKMKAVHMLAYVLACNDSIVLAGVRYIP